MKHRVLSGIRATGRLHLGNYLGAVKGMLALQNDEQHETLYMVADVHTITTPYEPDDLRRNRIEVIMDYLAVGLDPKKSVLFLQSEVPQHLELAFYFSSVVNVARMRHLPTFKDKVKQYPQYVTMALLNYPVLMSADILVYKADSVPVGVDQESHLETAREIARKMNEKYGTDFPEPIRFATAGGYVPSLKGEGKMSKSVEGSYINLTDEKEVILKKVMAVPSDSGQGKDIPTTGGVATLFTLVELFQGEELAKEYKLAYLRNGLGYKDLKTSLSKAIFEQLEPIQEKRRQLERNSDYVNDVIRQGVRQARETAERTVVEVREKMGLG